MQHQVESGLLDVVVRQRIMVGSLLGLAVPVTVYMSVLGLHPTVPDLQSLAVSLSLSLALSLWFWLGGLLSLCLSVSMSVCLSLFCRFLSLSVCLSVTLALFHLSPPTPPPSPILNFPSPLWSIFSDSAVPWRKKMCSFTPRNVKMKLCSHTTCTLNNMSWPWMMFECNHTATCALVGGGGGRGGRGCCCCSWDLLLLLLCSQQSRWDSPFLVRFLRVWPFFNTIIEVVTFRLCGYSWIYIPLSKTAEFKKKKYEITNLVF